MNKKFLFFSFITLFTLIGNAQSSRVSIKTNNLNESNYLKIDDFYLTHNLYLDLFLRENLFLDANKEEVSSVIQAIKKYVSEETPLEIEVVKPEGINYLIKVVLLKKDGAELLITFTNWNPQKKIFEEGITGDSYTRWYYLNDNKMTYRKNMSKEKDYSNLSNLQLANAYLFDEIIQNDSKIKNAIDDALKEEDLSIEDNITANLILLKYFIFKREKDKIKEQIYYLKEKFEANKSQPNLKGLEVAFKTTEFQIELMQ